MINIPARIATCLVIAALTPTIAATAQDPVVVPDFTKGAKLPRDSRHDWNLGPTGLRGWIFCDRLVTTDARQILITKVDMGSPAEGITMGDTPLLNHSDHTEKIRRHSMLDTATLKAKYVPDYAEVVCPQVVTEFPRSFQLAGVVARQVK